MTSTEDLAAAVAVETEQWPPDWPRMRPVITVGRGARADLMDAFADLLDKLPEIEQLDSALGAEGTPPASATRKKWETYAASRGVQVSAAMTRDQIIAAVTAANRPEQAQQMRRAAFLTRTVGQLVDVLSPCAEDPPGFDTWAATAADLDLLTLFMRYAKATHLPEASSSAN